LVHQIFLKAKKRKIYFNFKAPWYLSIGNVSFCICVMQVKKIWTGPQFVTSDHIRIMDAGDVRKQKGYWENVKT
jgi:hypothetical protein